MTNKQRKFFRLAKNASEMSSFPRAQIGCVVTHGSKVVCVGFNSRKSSPTQKKYNKYRDFYTDDTNTEPFHLLHAETSALRQLRYLDIDTSQCEVWTYREFKDGSPAIARPCSACLQMIKDLKIKKIHYSTNDGFADEEIIY